MGQAIQVTPVRMDGFLVPYMKAYMGADRIFDEEILKGQVQFLINSMANQFMKEKGEAKPGSFYASAATKPTCQNFFRMMGAEKDPKSADDLAEMNMKFAYGSLAEALVNLNSQLAYKYVDGGTPHSVGEFNSFIETPIGGKNRRGFIDGLISFNHTWHFKKYGLALYKPNAKYLHTQSGSDDQWEDLILEVKAVQSFAFEKALEEGITDDWGWLGQINCYQRSMKIHRGLFVLVDRGSGRFAEWLVPFSAKRAKLADFNAVLVEDRVAKKGPVPYPEGYEPEVTKYEKVLALANRKCGYCDYAGSCAAQQGYRLKRWDKEVTFMKKVSFTAHVRELIPRDGEIPPVVKKKTSKRTPIKDTIDTSQAATRKRDG